MMAGGGGLRDQLRNPPYSAAYYHTSTAHLIGLIGPTRTSVHGRSSD